MSVAPPCVFLLGELDRRRDKHAAFNLTADFDLRLVETKAVVHGVEVAACDEHRLAAHFDSERAAFDAIHVVSARAAACGERLAGSVGRGDFGSTTDNDGSEEECGGEEE